MPIHRRAVSCRRLKPEVCRRFEGRLAEPHARRGLINHPTALQPRIKPDPAGQGRPPPDPLAKGGWRMKATQLAHCRPAQQSEPPIARAAPDARTASPALPSALPARAWPRCWRR